jgi:hypothetical protein
MLTEKTLNQILDVLELTSKYQKTGYPVSKAYQKAVKEISHKYAVTYQTIADGCRRRLNLDNINEFMSMLTEWTQGNPRRLKELLLKNTEKLDDYRVSNFFNNNNIVSSSTNAEQSSKVEDTFETITFKIPHKVATQLRTLAEAEGNSIQNFVNMIIKKYLDVNYVEYVKSIIDSLPQEHKEKVINELSARIK